ncbi:MAG: response regulator [Lachnospiraceae bacterium]|nr:response regulator [Lachnospiraceae bacterium]MEE3461566.1 response regulator [Lachnospiraceae bacterium]
MRDKENETSYHIVILTVFTIMCILMDVIIVISHWGSIAVIPITLCCVFLWFLHFMDVGTAEFRIYIYVLAMIAALFYYAYFDYTITDIPIILCLLILILSRQKNPYLVIMIACSYLLYIAENVFITHFLNAHTEQIVYSRLALGIICLIGATITSLYFMRMVDYNENEKDALRAEAEEARDETKQFLSNMSHELRTPINVVKGIAELMLSGTLSPEDEKNMYAIYNAGKRMDREVADILSYSELQSGYFKLSEADYEIISVVNDSVSSVFGKYEQGLDFAVDIEPDIPKTLYGDAGRMTFLIVTLFDNAVKFTDIGGGYLYISKRDTDYGINLNIDIYDTGKGMNIDEQTRYKAGAYAGDTGMERKKGGLGLGLYIAHGIVDSMKGFISFKSSEEGTHVHVTIPQIVKDPSSSITLENAEKYYILCWFDRKKYVRREVGDYYFTMIDHAVKDIGVNAEIAGSLDELKQLCKTYRFTHILTTQMEYETDPAFFEEVSKKTWVGVFAGPDFKPHDPERVMVITKPVYVLSAVNFLKRTRPGTFIPEKNTENSEKINYNHITALVVDDEKMNLMVAKGILKKLGINAVLKESGPEAAAACQESDFDIIFMDYMMPEQNGTEAMKEIRRIRHGFYRNKPIVVLTANAVSGAKEAFLADGFDYFLSKPVSIQEMQKCIKKFIRPPAVKDRLET